MRSVTEYSPHGETRQFKGSSVRLFRLSKAVLRIKNNAGKFLNGLTANVLEAPQNAFLNIHGQIIATFDQFKISDDEFIVVLEQRFVESVLGHLDRYARLNKTSVIKEDYRVYFDLDSALPLESNELFILQKKGRLIVTRRDLIENVSPDEFTLFRLKNDIPVHGIDYQDEMLLNVNEEDFVSFTKGCFLGQEPVSKVHSRSKPTWKLVVKNEEDCSEEEKKKMTSKTFDPENKKIIGFIFVNNR